MTAHRRRGAADRGPRPLCEGLDEALTVLRDRTAAPRGAQRAEPGGLPRPGAGPGTGDRGAGSESPEGRGQGPARAWGAVFSDWEAVVGESLARHARPLRLDGAVLVVAVDHPAWATQVRALAPAILQRLADAAGAAAGPFARLEVVVRAS